MGMNLAYDPKKESAAAYIARTRNEIAANNPDDPNSLKLLGVSTPTKKFTLNPSGTSYSEAPSEPAVISSSTIDDLIATGKTKLNDLSQKGTTVGGDGIGYYANGDVIPDEPDEDSGKKYSISEFYGQDDGTPDENYLAIQSMFAPLKAALDENTLSQVNVIQQQFESLRKQQLEFNRRAETARSRSLLLGGSSRYAPLAASGTMLAQTEYGLQQIQDLNAKEDMAIAQAKAAQADGNMRLMMSALDMAETTRKEKQASAAKVMETIQKANDKMREARYQASRDEAIAGLVTQGITDPEQMINLLNKYEDGTSTGGDFTAEEIADTLKSFTVAEKKAEDLPADLQTFEYIRDNYGLPDEIAALDPEQQFFAYLAAVKKAETAPKTTGTGGLGYTPTELKKLRAVGIDPTNIKAADAYLYNKGNEVEVPTFEEYLDSAERARKMSFGPEAKAELKKQYDEEYGQYEEGLKPQPFTPTELKKLEAAGLLNATRKEQLAFLYKKKAGDSSDSSTMTDEELMAFLQGEN